MRHFLRRSSSGTAKPLTFVSRSADADRGASNPPAGGRTSRLAVLRHPLFLGALALLLVNDHALKGAGVLPGALTGKLSDFAGLIVAPVFAAALFGARGRRARALAFGAVTLPFIAIKLSAAAADALVALVGFVGLRWRIWQDPTDLAALAVLPVAWRICDLAVSRERAPHTSRAHDAPHAHDALRAPDERRAALAARARWLGERAAFAVAAAACVATSQGGPSGYFTDAYVVNGSLHEIDVRVRWLEATYECADIMAGDPSRMFGPSSFDFGVTYTLASGDTLPLNRDAAYAAAGVSSATDEEGPVDEELEEDTEGPCQVALIESDSMVPTIVWWDDLTMISVPANINNRRNFWTDTQLAAGRVLVAPPVAVPMGEVQWGGLYKQVARSECWDADQQSYQFTLLDYNLPSIATLDKVDVLPDGCLELTLGYPELSAGGPDPVTQTVYLCIPAEDFPFGAGEQLEANDDYDHLSLQATATGKHLSVYRRAQSVTLGGLIAEVVPGTCEGDRLDCGGYATAAVLSVQTGGQTTLLAPGEALSGGDFHVRLGRAEQVIAGRVACEPGYQQPIIDADFLITYQ